MKIGIIGLTNSGKTTVFNAITRGHAEVTSYQSMKVEPNIGAVIVPDTRIDYLSEMFQPKKTTYATIEYLDVAGVGSGMHKNESFGTQVLAPIKLCDAITMVLRNFEDDAVEMPENGLNPVREANEIESELLLSDLMIAEKRYERLEANIKRGQKSKENLEEQVILQKCLAWLETEKPLREMELSDQEKKVIRGFQFLTLKPLMYVINSDENHYGQSGQWLDELQKRGQTIEVAGKFEMELNQLDEEEAAEFMRDMGIEESALAKLARLSYSTLGLISFFTVGSDEVKAWTIRRGTIAVDAAGEIHSDLSRGFIRAETVAYEDLRASGSMKMAKEHAKLRLEGKEYLVQDGDIMNIRFNV